VIRNGAIAGGAGMSSDPSSIKITFLIQGREAGSC